MSSAEQNKKPDWPYLQRYILSSLKYALASLGLIPVFHVMMNPNFNSSDYWTGFGISLMIGIACAVFFCGGSALFYGIVNLRNPQLMKDLIDSTRFRIAKGLVMLLLSLLFLSKVVPYFTGVSFGIQGITTGFIIGTLCFLFISMFIAYKKIQENNLKLRAESAISNLNTLKNQMQPHFLFNSLNSMAELIELNKDQAALMTQKLSDLYREILENSKNQTSTLTSEISIVKKYLDFEQLRYGKRLSYKIENYSGNSELFVPSLMLQTLVENSIKHRIAKSISGGEIKLKIEPQQNAGGYFVTIEDHSSVDSNLQNFSPEKEPVNTGTGLKNVQERLKLIYKSNSQFQIEILKDQSRVRFWFSGEQIHGS